MKRTPTLVVTAFVGTALLLAVYGAAGTTEEAARFYKQGVQLGVQKKFSQAKVAFKQALRVEPNLVPAKKFLNLIAQIEAGTMKPEIASHIFKATDYANEGRLDQAIRELDRASKLQPRVADIYDLRGYFYYEKGNFDRAIADYNQALQINPRFAGALCNRGVAYGSKGEFYRAIADFNRSLEINPRDALTYNNRGNAYCFIGDFNRAIADYDHALQINTRYATAWFNKGLACEKAGRKAEARESYQNFLRYAPPQDFNKMHHARERIRALWR